jgi:CubicO group peptidase (beta-lactamase class C family)
LLVFLLDSRKKMKGNRAFLFYAVCLSAVCLACCTFTATTAELTAFFNSAFAPQALATNKVISISVAVVNRQGTVVFQQGYGYQDPATQTPASATQTIYRLASLTKTFTATTAMQLVEAGQLNLTADLNQYFQRAFYVCWLLEPPRLTSVPFPFRSVSAR